MCHNFFSLQGDVRVVHLVCCPSDKSYKNSGTSLDKTALNANITRKDNYYKV